MWLKFGDGTTNCDVFVFSDNTDETCYHGIIYEKSVHRFSNGDLYSYGGFRVQTEGFKFLKEATQEEVDIIESFFIMKEMK